MSKLQSLSCRLLTAMMCLTFPFSVHALVISEVYYDAPTPGTDDGREWVELFNATASAIDLSGYSLRYGGSNYTGVANLSGVVGSGAYFLIGGPNNAGLSFDLALNFSPDLQNSGNTADGIALFSPTNQIIDAVIYGVINSNNLLDESGGIGDVDVADAPAGSSIERVNLAGNWQVQGQPTAGSGPLQRPTAELSAPTPFTLLALGLVMIAILKLYPRYRIKGECNERALSTCFIGHRLAA